jgi:hypothetical protein
MPGLAPKTIFLSPDGNDSNDGLTAETAKASMGSVQSILASGDTINLAPNQYAGATVDGKTNITFIVDEPVIPVVNPDIGGGLPNVAGRTGRNAGVVMNWNDRPGQFVEPGRKVRG